MPRSTAPDATSSASRCGAVVFDEGHRERQDDAAAEPATSTAEVTVHGRPRQRAPRGVEADAEQP